MRKRSKDFVKSVLREGFTSTLSKSKNRLNEKLSPKLKKLVEQLTLKVDKQCYERLKSFYNAKEGRQHTVEPLVSIIIINRDGLPHLKRLFDAIHLHDEYKNFEIIIVDNASKDGSLAYLKKNPYDFALTLIKNSQNLSFSKANNQAVEVASGSYLLLLNNDVEPTSGWLSHLVETALQSQDIAMVGSKLIYPYKKRFAKSCTIQHAGIAFRYEGDFIRPYNIGSGELPQKNFNANRAHAAMTAASLLLKKELYLEVGGFDEGYNYGYEDVDLGLKLICAGYKNIFCADSVLFHYEFGTQKRDSKKLLITRRAENRALFQKKWAPFIKQRYWQEKIESRETLFSQDVLTVALAVTDAGDNISEGDYFTAKELANELERFGWKVIYLRRKYNEWYNPPQEVDLLISLLDAYEPSKLAHLPKKIITIAWARNWFDRWVRNSSFKMYDHLFASSSIACEYIYKHSKRSAELMPIATNPTKFDIRSRHEYEPYQCDYCFTGSYWNNERDIISFIDPERLPLFRFHIYGKNWEKIEKLRPYHRGFLPYEQMPLVYANTKIVIDDANHVTKPYGSVNSRVFDALASGTLVITNGKLGSELLFNGALPSFTTQDELYDTLDFYLTHEEKRVEKVAQLRQIVLERHTYAHRAQQLKTLLNSFYLKPSIAIKIPAPNWDVVHEWGDYHFALALKDEFEQMGYRVLLQVLSEWDNTEGSGCDIALVLRGLSPYKVQAHQVNIMWNISHPDKVSIEEYNSYDHIFIASLTWAKKIDALTTVDVDAMLQCTNEHLFRPLRATDERHPHQLLFVGNSRKIYRKIIKEIIPTPYELAIYGSRWHGLVDEEMIKGEHIKNDKLYSYYGSADIVLNDHWDDMREKGFISNRIFDVLASGGFVISDAVDGIESIFEDVVITYNGPDELKEKVDYYMQHPQQRIEKVHKGLSLISQHTFKSRAEILSKRMSSLLNQRIDAKV